MISIIANILQVTILCFNMSIEAAAFTQTQPISTVAAPTASLPAQSSFATQSLFGPKSATYTSTPYKSASFNTTKSTGFSPITVRASKRVGTIAMGGAMSGGGQITVGQIAAPFAPNAPNISGVGAPLAVPGPRRIPGDEPDLDPENTDILQPVGDGLWLLFGMAVLYAFICIYRKKALPLHSRSAISRKR